MTVLIVLDNANDGSIGIEAGALAAAKTPV